MPHTDTARIVLDRVKWVKITRIDVIGGNIATAEAALALVEHGADGVKVGIGPGSICTTRIVAGLACRKSPRLPALQPHLKAQACHSSATAVFAIRRRRVKALAAGAYSVMLSSMFAGTEESPGEVVLFQGRSYKEYRGMGSLGAMTQGSNRYFQANVEKLVPEGIEGRVS